MNIPKPYFKNINTIGSLEIEEIIFASWYPVLFTCRDKYNQLYLCVCCDIRQEQRWIISKTTIKTMVDLLTDKISIYNAFKSHFDEHYIVTWNNKDKEEKSKKVTFEEVDKLDLPLENEYLDSDIDEFKEYIEKLNKNEIKK